MIGAEVKKYKKGSVYCCLFCIKISRLRIRPASFSLQKADMIFQAT